MDSQVLLTPNSNVGRMPVLDGTNYAYWKLRIRTYLKSIDGQCWEACLKQYVLPLKEADAQGDKPPLKYS